MQVKTTDNLKEIFDVVDENDRIIGQATREECNRNPKLIHRAVYVLVFNSKGELFLQKRSQTKDICPGMWSVSVSGHVDQGESYKEAALREMAEEIGALSRVEFLDKYIIRGENETEYSSIYRAISDGPFQLNPVEIEKGVFFDLKTIKNQQWEKLTPSSKTVLENLDKKGLLFKSLFNL